jgi:hypothetical protein
MTVCVQFVSADGTMSRPIQSHVYQLDFPVNRIEDRASLFRKSHSNPSGWMVVELAPHRTIVVLARIGSDSQNLRLRHSYEISKAACLSTHVKRSESRISCSSRSSIYLPAILHSPPLCTMWRRKCHSATSGNSYEYWKAPVCPWRNRICPSLFVCSTSPLLDIWSL